MERTPEVEHLLSLVDQASEHKYVRVEQIRLLAGSEEDYRVIIREIDRVKSQILGARVEQAAATLTVQEWFAILDHWSWKCSYCKEKPFQVMSHLLPRREGGTTAENCVPACYSCVSKKRLEKIKRKKRS